MIAALKALHNISRPGETPQAGDIIEVECVGGFVKEVDPITQKTTTRHQRFRLLQGGGLRIIHNHHAR